MNTKQDAIIKAAMVAGSGAGKLATAVNAGLKGLKKASGEKFRDETYQLMLNGRKARELPEADGRAYAALRTAFSRAFKALGWSGNKPATRKKGAAITHEAVMEHVAALVEMLSDQKASSDFNLAAGLEAVKTCRAALNALAPQAAADAAAALDKALSSKKK